MVWQNGAKVSAPQKKIRTLQIAKLYAEDRQGWRTWSGYSNTGILKPIRIQIRKNFNETAFFFPDLKTDAGGNVEISFTMPEALTQWKWMIFAHTKDLAFGYSEKSVITQKELMLQPNMPRFFREGDTMQLPVKISNLSAATMTGTVQLDWLDATNNSNQNIVFQNKKRESVFQRGSRAKHGGQFSHSHSNELSTAGGLPAYRQKQMTEPVTEKKISFRC